MVLFVSSLKKSYGFVSPADYIEAFQFKCCNPETRSSENLQVQSTSIILTVVVFLLWSRDRGYIISKSESRLPNCEQCMGTHICCIFCRHGRTIFKSQIRMLSNIRVLRTCWYSATGALLGIALKFRKFYYSLPRQINRVVFKNCAKNSFRDLRLSQRSWLRFSCSRIWRSIGE